MVLIPGLPDDLARECLVRVHYSQFSTLSLVCKAWKSELQSPELRLYRKQTSNIQKVIVVPHFGFEKEGAITPVQLALLEPETGDWSCLPPVPQLPNRRILKFCEVVSCMSSFVALIGLDSNTDINVFVFDFLSSAWRRGPDLLCSGDMYPVARTSDGNHMVYVLCESHDPLAASKSRILIVYDTTEDEWITLSKMAIATGDIGRRPIFHRGKIHFVNEEEDSEKLTWRQFDVSTLQWDVSQQNFLNSLERLCVMCYDGGEWYGCSNDGDVFVLRGSRWKAIAKLPSEVYKTVIVTVWKNKLVVLGFERYEFLKDYEAYVLDLKNKQWTRVPNMPRELGFIHSPCSVEI